jgi:hypothetical protein
MSCVYYYLLSFGVLLPLLLYLNGDRVTRKVRVSCPNDLNLDSISTCLIYNIYLLLHLGSHA